MYLNHAKFILIDKQPSGEINIDKPIQEYIDEIYIKLLGDIKKHNYDKYQYTAVHNLKNVFSEKKNNRIKILIELIESANNKFSFTKTKYKFTLEQLYDFLETTKTEDIREITLENFKLYLNNKTAYLNYLTKLRDYRIKEAEEYKDSFSNYMRQDRK